MKILIAGATGAIGGAFLNYTLRRNEITEVIALTRRPLSDIPGKVENIIIQNFGDWESLDDAIWQKIQDADAMIWAIGTYNLNEHVNMRYPLAFQEAFAKRLPAPQEDKKLKFRFILLSGAFVEPNQSRTLLFLSQQRKIKGLTESKTIEFAETHKHIWEAFVIRPGGILFGDSLQNNLAEFVFGSKLVIRSEELGAYVADLVVNGSEDGTVIRNLKMVEYGRKLLHEAV